MEIFYIALLTIFASIFGTISGFGTSTIMVPILSLFMPIQLTLLVVGIIHWFGDIWKIILFRSKINWKILLFFGGFGIVASYFGAYTTLNIDKDVLANILGIFLIIYVIFLFLKPKFKLPQNILTTSLGGLLSGFCAGIFGVGGAIRAMFLTAFNLKKTIYIFTSSLIAFFIDITRISTYFFENVKLEQDLLFGFLFFIPASFIGTRIGKMLIDKIPQNKFRIVVSIFLFLIGLKLLLF